MYLLVDWILVKFSTMSVLLKQNLVQSCAIAVYRIFEESRTFVVDERNKADYSAEEIPIIVEKSGSVMDFARKRIFYVGRAGLQD